MIISLMIAFSAFVQGITSFGFSLMALPLLALVLPVSQIVPMLVLYSILLNLIMLFQLYKFIHLELIITLLLGGLLGIPFGIWLLKHLDPVILRQLAGALIVCLSTFLLSGKRVVLKRPKHFYGPIGLVAGVLQGSLSLSGPPIVLFLSNQNVDKMTFRANLTAFFTAMNLVSIPGFLWSGLLTVTVLNQALASLPLMLLGLVVGLVVAKRLQENLFKQVALALMLLSGVMALLS
jgi:uncharacterized membrane protein YfcA